jgi:hypothetical protein
VSAVGVSTVSMPQPSLFWPGLQGVAPRSSNEQPAGSVSYSSSTVFSSSSTT